MDKNFIKKLIVGIGGASVIGGSAAYTASVTKKKCPVVVTYQGDELCLTKKQYKELQSFINDNGLCRLE